MREEIFCPICSKKKWSEVVMIELGLEENTIEVVCPICHNRYTKVIRVPQQENKSPSGASSSKEKV